MLEEKIAHIERGIEKMEKNISGTKDRISRMVEMLAKETSRDKIAACTVNSIMANIATDIAELEALEAKKRLMLETVQLLKIDE